MLTTDSNLLNRKSMKTNYKLLFLMLLACCLTTSISAQNISAAEYFWDTDPGVGNATTMTAADGNFNNRLEKILANTATLPATGVHTFNMRVRDAANKWSPTFKTIIDINPASVSQRSIKISLGEYFWDNDPGQGNGTALIAFDGAFDDALETVVKTGISLPTVGIHTFQLRVRDAESNWGPVFKTLIDITPGLITVRPVKITTAEYFWDADPGAGNGVVLIAYDGAFDDALETVAKSGIGLPTAGVHKFNVRVRDAQNQWSKAFSTVIEVTPNLISLRNIRVTAAEYYFDTDPGPGNATPMLAFDGNFNSVFEAIKGGNIPSPVLMGKHVLYLRAKGASGQWGKTFGVVVNMDIDIDNFITDISGAAALCYSTALNNTYTSVAHLGNTYSWSIVGGTITAGSGTNIVQVNWSFTGSHKLTLIECNSLGTVCDTDSIVVSVSPPTTQTINRWACAGDSLFLQGAWRKTAGLYHDSLLSIGGCDSIVHTNFALYPSYNLTANAGFCTGQSVVVGGVTITAPGSYTQHFLSIDNCDSTVVTTVTEYTVSIVNTNAFVCAGDSIYLQGAYQTQPGTYTDVLASSQGCDSVVVTQLAIAQASSSVQSVSICNGDSILLGGAYQTTANVYVDVIPNAYNCDSTITTTLVVLPSYRDTVYTSISFGDSILLGGNYQSTPGYYNDTLLALNGCDSILVTSLSVLVDNSKFPIGVLSPQIFPNPFLDNLNLKIAGTEPAVIAVMEVTGRVVYRGEGTASKRLEINTKEWTSGIYLVQLTQGKYTWRWKLVKMK